MKTKEEREESKAFRELRKENIKLRNEVQRLRKIVSQLEAAQVVSDEMEDISDLSLDSSQNIRKCPKCHKKINKVIMLRQKEYFICDNCGSKGPLK